MNNDISQGQWKQIQGKAKALWGKLTDDDLERASGKVEVLAGLLQERYGYTRQRAVKDIDKHLTEDKASYKNNAGPTPVK